MTDAFVMRTFDRPDQQILDALDPIAHSLRFAGPIRLARLGTHRQAPDCGKPFFCARIIVIALVYNGFKVDTVIFAKPWWVNLLLVVPFLTLYFWRRERHRLDRRTLVLAAAFAAAFGMVEAISVDYLRGNIADLPSFQAKDVTNPQT